MKNINYRAWGRNEMFYDEEIATFPNGEILYEVGDGSELFKRAKQGRGYIQGFQMLLSSGLRDRDNQEIYEGDIVENEAFRDEVIFEKGVFTTKNSVEDKFGVKQPLAVHDNLKVIGDIYQNEDLIKFL